MQIAQPYLLFLGDVTDPLAAKTARGIYQWRPEICLGQIRLTPATVSLGLTDMTLQQAQQQGAKTLVLGTANPKSFPKPGKLPYLKRQKWDLKLHRACTNVWRNLLLLPI